MFALTNYLAPMVHITSLLYSVILVLGYLLAEKCIATNVPYLSLMNSQTNFPYNRKRTIYVGGFGEDVDEKTLHAAFIPFGDIVDVSMPLDFETNKHRGFGFIEFEMDADAAAAVDNMNKGELFGRTIHVNFARPPRPNERMLKPVWADDEWLKQYGSSASEGKSIVEGTSGLHEVIESLTGVQEKSQPRKQANEDE